jgi:hypothetical protein
MRAMVDTFNVILALTVLIIVFKIALWSWRLHLRHRGDRSFSGIFHMMFAPRTAADMSAGMWKHYANSTMELAEQFSLPGRRVRSHCRERSRRQGRSIREGTMAETHRACGS